MPRTPIAASCRASGGWCATTRRVQAGAVRTGPSTGEVAAQRDSTASDGYVRVDDGVAEGGEVSMFYDPMIAKLVTWAPTRDEAAALQVEALDAFRIEGLGHNIDFLSAIMQHPRFLAGELTTGFIAEEYPDGFQGAPASEETLRAHRRGRRGHRIHPPAPAPARPAARSTARRRRRSTGW